MHKKLSSELTSLAHKILQMNNKDNVFLLKEKAHELYEKLSVLAYIEEYINNTPQATETKEELVYKFEQSQLYKENKLKEEEIPSQNNLQEDIETNEVVEETKEEIIEQPFDEFENLLFDEEDFKEETQQQKVHTLDDELKGTIPVDITTKLLEKSLNDKLQNTIQIELNDRIAFVQNLFDGNQGDFNRVISQLNTFDTEREAKSFLRKTVKPDYDWSEKEEYEHKLIQIIEKRFE